MDVRPGGIFSIVIAGADGPDSPNLGCFLEVIPMERLVWTSMLFPGYRPAVFEEIPITAIVTMEPVGQNIRLLPGHRNRRRSVRGARDRDEVILGVRSRTD